MRALLIADQDGDGLGALTRRIPTALLPMAGIPLVERALVELASVGVREAAVAVSRRPDLFRALLGDGTLWGLKLDLVLTRGDEDPEALAKRYARRLGEEFLVMRADIVRGDLAADFLPLARAEDKGVVGSTCEDADAGLTLHRPGKTGKAVLSVPRRSAAALRTPADYHRANLAILEGRPSGAPTPGRPGHGGTQLGLNSRLPASAIAAGPILLGRNCIVSSSAKLGPGVVLGDDALIDDGAALTRTVVMPGSYIGRGMLVHDAIVCGSEMIRIDLKTSVTVDEESWLSELPRYEPWWAAPMRADQLAALTLILLSAPLWPIAAVLALLDDPRQPLRSHMRMGNAWSGGRRREYRSWSFAGPFKVLRGLPRLLDVVRAEVRLIGTLAARAQALSAPDDELPVGLFSPASGMRPKSRALLETQLLREGRSASWSAALIRLMYRKEAA